MDVFKEIVISDFSVQTHIGTHRYYDNMHKTSTKSNQMEISAWRKGGEHKIPFLVTG